MIPDTYSHLSLLKITVRQWSFNLQRKWTSAFLKGFFSLRYFYEDCFQCDTVKKWQTKRKPSAVNEELFPFFKKTKQTWVIATQHWLSEERFWPDPVLLVAVPCFQKLEVMGVSHMFWLWAHGSLPPCRLNVWHCLHCTHLTCRAPTGWLPHTPSPHTHDSLILGFVLTVSYSLPWIMLLLFLVNPGNYAWIWPLRWVLTSALVLTVFLGELFN